MTIVCVTYNVLDAKLVSSCFNCPSKARPHLSLLLARRGVSVNTLLNVNPGPMGQPSLPNQITNTHFSYSVNNKHYIVDAANPSPESS